MVVVLASYYISAICPINRLLVIGALDQQTSKIGVAGMGDTKLRVMISGLTSTRSQAKIAADIATSSEPLLAAERQHEGRGGEMTDAVNLQQCLRLRILGLSELLDLPTTQEPYMPFYEQEA
jgi:hypothetical protein